MQAPKIQEYELSDGSGTLLLAPLLGTAGWQLKARMLQLLGSAGVGLTGDVGEKNLIAVAGAVLEKLTPEQSMHIVRTLLASAEIVPSDGGEKFPLFPGQKSFGFDAFTAGAHERTFEMVSIALELNYKGVFLAARQRVAPLLARLVAEVAKGLAKESGSTSPNTSPSSGPAEG
jgi:hypothetical protein